MNNEINAVEISFTTRTFLATTVRLDLTRLVLRKPEAHSFSHKNGGVQVKSNNVPLGKIEQILLSSKLAGGEPKVIKVDDVLQKYLPEKRLSTLFNKVKACMPFQIKVVEQAGRYSLSDDTAAAWAEAVRFKEAS